MSERARYVVERFPDLAYAIKQYSSDNRFFRGLCEDYGEAVEALRQCETWTVRQLPSVPTPAARSSWISNVKFCLNCISGTMIAKVLLELPRWTVSGSTDDAGRFVTVNRPSSEGA